VGSLHDLDSEIEVLEITVKIVNDSGLKELLSDKYTSRGISCIIQAQEQLEKSNKESKDYDIAKSEIKKGIKDLVHISNPCQYRTIIFDYWTFY